MALPKIQISPDGHYLSQANGDPFFWLGDTAWELFHRQPIDEIEKYFDIRSRQGFNVVQAVVLSEFDGLTVPNANGDLPLYDHDPTRPNEAYFRYIDEILKLAEAREIYIGLLPTWGDKVLLLLGWGGSGPVIFNSDNARAYGEFLGKRYCDFSNLIWILGGDRPAQGVEAIWKAMAAGIEAGMGSKPLVTFHPNGRQCSSDFFPDASWLDFHMCQSGHRFCDYPNWEIIFNDYQRQPTKPVLDGEMNYEDHPIDISYRDWKPEHGRFNDYDVRKQAYRSVFAGACGITYGHHSVWQFHSPARAPFAQPVFFWEEALYRPGAVQLIHLKNLMLSLPYFNRFPDQEMLVSDAGKEGSHIQATRSSDGSYALIYLPQANQSVQVDFRSLSGSIQARWFDPRNGQLFDIGEFAHAGVHQFVSPQAGPDWVLVLQSNLMHH